ncbi:MAG: ArnT family glycosyltransferase [Phycisphaerales bacterium]
MAAGVVQAVNAGARAAAWVYLTPAVVLLAVALPHLAQGDWQRTDSGRYAAIGLQAWRTGSLWTLYAEPGQPYFNKPPLVIWIHGLALHALGPGAPAARLPGVAAALGCVLVIVALTRRTAGDRAGLCAGVALGLTYEFFRRTREISPDLWQLFFMLLFAWAMVAAGDATRRRTARFVVLAGLALGAGLMCKPFTALLAPVCMGAWLVWTCGVRALWIAFAAGGVGVLLAAPWHLSMAWLHGSEFIDQYLGLQVATRAAGALPVGEGGHEPAWFYAAQLVRTGWPWIGVAAIGLVARVRGTRLTDSGRAETWALAWFVVWFAALTLFPDRRDRYALVLHPAIAVLAGVAVAPWTRPWPGFERAAVALAALVGACGVVVAVLPIRVQRPIDPQWTALYAWIDVRVEARELRPDDFWQGAFAVERGARVYLRYGEWPRPTRDARGRFVVDRESEPAAGAVLLYHRRDGLAPGPNESILFESGDLRVTRLQATPWSPSDAPDPGG